MLDEPGEGAPQSAQTLTIEDVGVGQRLDNFLLRQLKGVPRTRIYRALRKGEVRVNKGRVRADYRLVAGDKVRIPPLRVPSTGQPAHASMRLRESLARAVIYQDQQLLAINKPSGLAVHGGSGISIGLIEALRQVYPGIRYLELVHRLDRDTSGLVLVAKCTTVLRELHRQLRDKQVEKRYLALVAGKWPAAVKAVQAPLEKNILHRKHTHHFI